MNLSKERRRELEKQEWFVHPNGEFIQRSITEELTKRGVDVTLAARTIEHKGKSKKSKTVSGFLIGRNFDMIEWLINTKSNLEGFDAYHADFVSGPWEKYRKGEKTPAERNREERIAKQMREKKKKLPPRKSALMYKNRGR